MPEELLDVRREGDVCVVGFRRPEKLNAISTAVEQALLVALAGPDLRESRCVVFSGSERAFSAGADLVEERDESPGGIDAYYRDTGDVYERVAALPQPTFSAISGWCLGAGFELALATDFRIADGTAVFGLPEVALGIVPSSGGTYRLVRALGPARAKELLLLRPRVDAAEAFRLGLVTETVAAGRALERALELAAEVAALPPLAASAAKQAANAIAESGREAGILVERLAYAALAQTEEAREAGRAFGRRGRGDSG
ncbi:MAG TPA: enoyl-CoA hydratase/isomerase family protein [Gaiellaceae bacterium]|nr:enoyl-CoA hydratase/isomerase family protein [Gaiellaceae bacterium]